MFGKMKQMMELQKKAKELQKKLEALNVRHAQDGVQITVNGLFKVESLSIDPSLLGAENKARLESLLCRAFTAAVQEVQKKSAQESQSLLAGFSL